MLMTDTLPNLHTIDTGQCFPFWLYEERNSTGEDVFGGVAPKFRRREAIADHALALFRDAYPSEDVSKEDIFHYVYGLLHSSDYRSRFAANLAKELPRIPCVESVDSWRRFRDAGRRLGELHVGYEKVTPYPATLDIGGRPDLSDAQRFYVKKMRHPGKGKDKDRSTVIYNEHVTVRDIPDAAWGYVVNGKPALAWVMDRQGIRVDRPSGIVSDANRYAVETVGDPRYPLDLLLRVVNVSLETVEIVRSLPSLFNSQ